MFKIIRNTLAVCVSVLLFVLSFNLISHIYNSPRLTSDFSHSEILEINPAIVIDNYTLFNDNTPYELKRLQDELVNRGILVRHPMFGIFINPDKIGQSFNMIIQSPGGLVVQGMGLYEVLKSISTAGIRINCYVSEAQSMAFFIMATSCSKVVAKKNVLLMQHRSGYGANGKTPSTYKTDIIMATLESAHLGTDFKNWLKLTRTEEDHVFTEEEIKKYKLVDEWVD
jgi:hypothetical protein